MLAGLFVSVVALRGIADREGRSYAGANLAVIVYWLIFAVTIAAWRIA